MAADLFGEGSEGQLLYVTMVSLTAELLLKGA